MQKGNYSLSVQGGAVVLKAGYGEEGKYNVGIDVELEALALLEKAVEALHSDIATEGLKMAEPLIEGLLAKIKLSNAPQA